MEDFMEEMESGDCMVNSPHGSPPLNLSEKLTLPKSSNNLDTGNLFEIGFIQGSLHSKSSDVGSGCSNMQMRGVSSEAFRVSASSAPSSSSQGSLQDDYNVRGDVYVWGESIWDGLSIDGTLRKTHSLVPKQLESALILDTQNIACGGKHAALITRQGELFTWGEDSGGRLGLGVGTDFSQPQLVDALANTCVVFVACGEYHTCAVTKSGELYTWGDGIHHVGLLGHGNDISHWIPRKVSGLLEGVKISFVACGTWHVALVTSGGQLFTFGEGTFGVLGHGDCKSVSYPREVEALKGLKTFRAACGVWHTAALVEVMGGCSSTGNCFSGKLFTWGDGDKGRLGHGDKRQKLVPVCVTTLPDKNFQQVGCGHSLTIVLASGQVFTMGSSCYGQLGTPHSNGMTPCLVEGKLAEETVEDIACGAYHVAVLTAKNEVYTWGKGANGRLGHGDLEDRKTPTLIEALKDKQVKKIACGSNFTAAICLHKWVSGADQSVCSRCRQSFGFTRKRHSCYHCGLVYCHSCSSKKALNAALAPNANKIHRVCDACYMKLKKASEAGMATNNNTRSILWNPNDSRERSDKPDMKGLRTPWLPTLEQFRQLEGKSHTKRGKKSEQSLSSNGALEAPTLLQLKDFNFFNSIEMPHEGSKTFHMSFPQTGNTLRAVSAFSRRLSPPRSETPTPRITSLASPKCVVDDLKKMNEVLTQEVLNLRGQVENLTKQCQIQVAELQWTAEQLKEATTLAAEESSKCKAAKEVIRSLTAQMKDMAQRLPAGAYDSVSLGPAYHLHILAPNGTDQTAISYVHPGIDTETANGHPEAFKHGFILAASNATVHDNGREPLHDRALRDVQPQSLRLLDESGSRIPIDTETANGHPEAFKHGFILAASNATSVENGREPLHDRDLRDVQPQSVRPPDESGSRIPTVAVENGQATEQERVEQDEPGVYLTLVSLPDGTKSLKRVRFSRKRFSEQQAEIWWSENRGRVFEQYMLQGINRAMTGMSVEATPGKEEVSFSSSNPMK